MVGEQLRRRPACASAQSDQRICYSLICKLSYLDLLRVKFNFLASPCSCEDCFESRFVGNPEARFCRVAAHFSFHRYVFLIHQIEVSKYVDKECLSHHMQSRSLIGTYVGLHLNIMSGQILCSIKLQQSLFRSCLSIACTIIMRA